MGSILKYIMFIKESDNGMKTAYPVIFPNHLVHDEVAEALLTGPLQGYEPRSAGEVSSLGMGDHVGGRSTTLNLKPHPDDRNIINMQDYGGYFV